MSVDWLLPYPKCGEQRAADSGHRICQVCEGKRCGVCDHLRDVRGTCKCLGNTG